MALKFLNKKGWHTGSLRNIETVWKAEQKHESEQKKLEELRKQIHDEREKSEFRLMQEQAGLVPKQERLEFLYDSGLQVGKVAQADEYLLGKPLEEAVKPENEVAKVAATPGALFAEEKPASANDSWRKLHSDPLFLIRQQEQAAIARIKSNPVKMAEIKKSAEMKKKLKEEKKKKRKEAKRERREKKKQKKQHSSSSEESSDSDAPRRITMSGHYSEGDGLKEKRKRLSSRSPSRSPVRKEYSRSPSKLRGDALNHRDDFKGEGSKREHKASDRRDRESEYSVYRSHEFRDSSRRSRPSEKADEGREVRSRHDYSEENHDRHHRRHHEVDDYRHRSSRGDDKRGGYNHQGDEPDAKRMKEDDRRARYDGGEGARYKSSDIAGHKGVDLRGSRDRESDRRRSSGDTELHDRDSNRGRERRPMDDRDLLQESKNVNHEVRHNINSPDGERGKRYGLIMDQSTSEGKSHRQSSISGPVDDLKSKKIDVSEKKLDAEDQAGGRKDIDGATVATQSKPVNRGKPPRPGQLSDAERAARLAEMQANADLHEEQRWQRLKRAADADAAEVKQVEKDVSNEKFISDTQKSIFGTEKISTSSTIEKSVKRRAHFIERSSADNERNAFRR